MGRQIQSLSHGGVVLGSLSHLDGGLSSDRRCCGVVAGGGLGGRSGLELRVGYGIGDDGGFRLGLGRIVGGSVVDRGAVHHYAHDAAVLVGGAQDVAVALALEEGAVVGDRTGAPVDRVAVDVHVVEHRTHGDHHVLVLVDVVQSKAGVAGAGAGHAVYGDAGDFPHAVGGILGVGDGLDYRVPGHRVVGTGSHCGAAGDGAGAVYHLGGHHVVARGDVQQCV